MLQTRSPSASTAATVEFAPMACSARPCTISNTSEYDISADSCVPSTFIVRPPSSLGRQPRQFVLNLSVVEPTVSGQVPDAHAILYARTPKDNLAPMTDSTGAHPR